MSDRALRVNVMQRGDDPNQFAKYQTYFVDSVTALGRMCFAWSEQQPEALSERTGKKDLRGVYGLHAREMIGMLKQLQRARATSIILVAILERTTDEFNRSQWDIQIEGSKTVRELPGIIDELITYQFVDFGDGKLIRAFVCTSPNPWGYPAKDRSGRLEQFEPPHLGKLLDKLQSVYPAANTAIEQAAE